MLNFRDYSHPCKQLQQHSDNIKKLQTQKRTCRKSVNNTFVQKEQYHDINFDLSGTHEAEKLGVVLLVK